MARLGDTHNLARLVAQKIELPAVLALKGNLGSGKTAFTQALAEAYGLPGPYPSPTFTLLNEYSHAGLTFIHADFYRLDSESEAHRLGIQDYFGQPNTVVVVEWADRFPSLFPDTTLWLTFELEKGRRVATLTAKSPALLARFEPKGAC